MLGFSFAPRWGRESAAPICFPHSITRFLISILVPAIFLTFSAQLGNSGAQPIQQVAESPRDKVSFSPRPRVPVSPRPRVSASQAPRVPVSPSPEYLWYEAENMRGFATQPTGEPILNPSWQNLPKAKAPGWGINGPGVSAEWSQGGESEWNSAAASADETAATIYQDIEIPRSGNYRMWVRYADWANRSESFVIRITQDAEVVTRRR